MTTVHNLSCSVAPRHPIPNASQDVLAPTAPSSQVSARDTLAIFSKPAPSASELPITQAFAPPPTERMPHLKSGLVAGITHLFVNHDAPLAAAKVRRTLPTVLEHFFPWARWGTADAKGMSFYLADCVLLYALQSAKALLPQPHFRAFIDDFCAALSVARKITRNLENGEDIESVIEVGVRRYLREGRIVLCPGGVNQHTDGHAVMTMLLPQPDGHTICAVFNRGEGLFPWHHRDALSKPQPWVTRLPTEALCGAAGAKPLGALLALQTPHENHTMDAFYAALNALVGACAGAHLLSGSPDIESLSMPGQSLQKAEECTISNTLAAMNFMMHVQLRCWQHPPSCSAAEAHTAYREIKYACRKVILLEVMAERERAIAQGETSQVVALTRALGHAAAFLQERLSTKPALRTLYEALPADIRLCVDTF